jgi:ATP-dependent protease ClpP protease subunit
MLAAPQGLPQAMYGSFSGPIDQEAVTKLLGSFTNAYRGGVREIHLFFYSHGGSVSDAVALYNYFRGLPLDLHIYNGSVVDSAAIIPFVGGHHRYSSAHAGFMFHTTKITLSDMIADAGGHGTIARNLNFDDRRAQAIIQAHTPIPPTWWTTFDLVMNPQEALKFGLIEDIREFKIPDSAAVFSL